MNKELIELAEKKLDEQERMINKAKKGLRPIRYPLRTEELEDGSYKFTRPIIYKPLDSSKTMILLFEEASKEYQSVLLNVTISVE